VPEVVVEMSVQAVQVGGVLVVIQQPLELPTQVVVEAVKMDYLFLELLPQEAPV
jgi:hypothetical protein